MSEHVYLRTFQAAPEVGETAVVTMPLVDGGMTTTVGTYAGVIEVEDEPFHSLTNAIITGPYGTFISDLTAWPVALTEATA